MILQKGKADHWNRMQMSEIKLCMYRKLIYGKSEKQRKVNKIHCYVDDLGRAGTLNRENEAELIPDRYYAQSQIQKNYWAKYKKVNL